MTHYFHVTFKSRIDSIKKRGIVPGRPRNWRNMFGDRLGKTTHVYAFTSFDEAIGWAWHMEWEFTKDSSTEEIAIVVSENPNCIFEPDSLSGFTYRSGVMTRNVVAPETIVEVIPLTGELKQALGKAWRENIPLAELVPENIGKFFEVNA